MDCGKTSVWGKSERLDMPDQIDSSGYPFDSARHNSERALGDMPPVAPRAWYGMR